MDRLTKEIIPDGFNRQRIFFPEIKSDLTKNIPTYLLFLGKTIFIVMTKIQYYKYGSVKTIIK